MESLAMVAGIGIALLGVWLSNRSQQKANERARERERIREVRFERCMDAHRREVQRVMKRNETRKSGERLEPIPYVPLFVESEWEESD